MHILMIMATLFVFYECTIENLATRQITIGCLRLACSKRSDSGERCEVKKAMKSRGGLGREVRERF